MFFAHVSEEAIDFKLDFFYIEYKMNKFKTCF